MSTPWEGPYEGYFLIWFQNGHLRVSNELGMPAERERIISIAEDLRSAGAGEGGVTGMTVVWAKRGQPVEVIRTWP